MPMAVLFTCSKCGIDRLRVNVRPRDARTPVVQWIQSVSREVAIAHAMWDLFCPADTIQDLMIPCRENCEWVGQDMPEEELERAFATAPSDGDDA